MRVLVFGDSITQGMWDTEGGWVDRIRKHYDTVQIQELRRRDEPVIFNLGVSADNTESILERIETETIARTRHGNLPIVVVQIGVNDSSFRGKTVQVDIETYKHNLVTVAKKVRPLSSGLVFIGLSACDEAKTNPCFWGEYYYKNVDIKTYEDAMASVAKDNSVPFIAVFEAFQAECAKQNLLSDGLHPNNAGHQLIVDLIQPELNKLLNG